MTGLNHEITPSCSDSQRIILHLYVVGEHTHSRAAQLTVRQLCEKEFAIRYELTTIDLKVCPEWAQTKHILVAPTLVRVHPRPERRCVGDLSDAGAMKLLLQSWLEEVGCHFEC